MRKFAEPSTADAPPKRRKATHPLRIHNKQKWDAQMPRIRELYKGNKLSVVIQKLEAEGFVASESQLRKRLNAGESSKNLRLTDRKWNFIARNMIRRNLEDPNKKTAFRYKESREVIPSSKIKRTLERRIVQKDFLDNGFRLKATLLRDGSCTIFGIERSSHPQPSQFTIVLPNMAHDLRTRIGVSGSTLSIELANVEEVSLGFINKYSQPAEAMLAHFLKKFSQEYSDDNFTVELGDCPTILIRCADCQDFYLPLGFGTWRRKRQEIVTGFQFDHPELDCLMEIAVALDAFERQHLASNRHRERVRLRILGNPEQWIGRSGFVTETGLTCKHHEPPLTVAKETIRCWSPGGCRWSQLKAVEAGQTSQVRQGEEYYDLERHETAERQYEATTEPGELDRTYSNGGVTYIEPIPSLRVRSDVESRSQIYAEDHLGSWLEGLAEQTEPLNPVGPGAGGLLEPTDIEQDTNGNHLYPDTAKNPDFKDFLQDGLWSDLGSDTGDICLAIDSLQRFESIPWPSAQSPPGSDGAWEIVGYDDVRQVWETDNQSISREAPFLPAWGGEDLRQLGMTLPVESPSNCREGDQSEDAMVSFTDYVTPNKE